MVKRKADVKGEKMAKITRTYIVPMRRVREGRTDYRQRMKLLKSGQPRFVVRTSLKNISCQVVVYEPKGDRTVAAAHSKVLSKYGWKGPCGNIPAAYLTGLLTGLMAKKIGISSGILDIGLYRSSPGSRIYACLKGLLDAGITIPHSSQILPSQDRIIGKHIARWANMLKAEPERYKRMFSLYLKAGIEPENIEKQFLDVKEKILKG
jgi:large subunit ribosomal protein L18